MKELQIFQTILWKEKKQFTLSEETKLRIWERIIQVLKENKRGKDAAK